MKSHRFDAISFISGVVAVVFGLVFLIPQTPVDLIDALTSLGAWFWPALLVVVGVAILVPVFASRSSKEEVEVHAEDQQV
jgi:cytochrome c-type biogenesis protein CcmH/NrfF